VGDFPAADHTVTVLLKVLVEDKRILRGIFRGDPLRWLVPIKRHSLGTVEVSPCTLGVESMQETRPGRAALRSIAVGIREQNTLSRKCVEIWGYGLWMPTHCTDPIVQVIDNNEDDIGLIFRLCDTNKKEKG